MSTPPTTSQASIQRQIEALGPWFHNLHLPSGHQTAPDHWLGDFPSFKWDQLRGAIPEDLAGWRVLDIGCNAGFYSIELAKRGAAVLGIDLDEHYLRQARWAAGRFGLDGQLRFKKMQVYDLARLEERFDLVLFMGVFYHLRYPLLGLDLVAEKTDRLLLFQTLSMPGQGALEVDIDRGLHDRAAMLDEGWPKMAFIEHRLMNDPTNWWAPNHAGIEAMLRSAGLRVIDHPASECYLCEPAQGPRTWDGAELDAACGRDGARGN